MFRRFMLFFIILTICMVAESSFYPGEEEQKFTSQVNLASSILLKVCQSPQGLEEDMLALTLAENLIPSKLPEINTDALAAVVLVKGQIKKTQALYAQNLAMKHPINTPEYLNYYLQGVNCLCESLDSFTLINNTFLKKDAYTLLDQLMQAYANSQPKNSIPSEHVLHRIEFFTSMYNKLHKVYQDSPSEMALNHLRSLVFTGLNHISDIHRDLENYLHQYRQKTKIISTEAKKDSDIEVTLKILNFIEKCLENKAGMNLVTLEIPLTLLNKNNKHLEQKKSFHELCKVTSLDELQKMVMTTYCGLLVKSSREENAPQKYKFASLLYGKHLYEGQYDHNPDLKKRFLEANMEYLVGNYQPLNEFYHQLRQNKIGEKVKKAYEKQKNSLKEKDTPAQQENKNTSYLPSKPAFISSTTQSAPTDIGQPKEEKYIPPQIKEKVKKRGTPKPISSNSKSDLALEPTIEPEMSIFRLNKKDHKTFESLINTSLDRNISTGDIKHLLTNLKCSVEEDKAKGVHQKAKAPNGQSWVIPKPWDGPIPDYYRLQLNDFIQNKMNIDINSVLPASSS